MRLRISVLVLTLASAGVRVGAQSTPLGQLSFAHGQQVPNLRTYDFNQKALTQYAVVSGLTCPMPVARMPDANSDPMPVARSGSVEPMPVAKSGCWNPLDSEH